MSKTNNIEDEIDTIQKEAQASLDYLTSLR
jgi:hypothetical protein